MVAHLTIWGIFLWNFRTYWYSGIKYDPKIGILGLNVTVRLARPGFSVATRSKHKASVGKNHRISPDEAKAYLTKEFGASVY